MINLNSYGQEADVLELPAAGFPGKGQQMSADGKKILFVGKRNFSVIFNFRSSRESTRAHTEAH